MSSKGSVKRSKRQVESSKGSVKGSKDSVMSSKRQVEGSKGSVMSSKRYVEYYKSFVISRRSKMKISVILGARPKSFNKIWKAGAFLLARRSERRFAERKEETLRRTRAGGTCRIYR